MDAPDRTDLRPRNLPEQIAYIVGHTLGLLKREEGVDQEDPEALKAWSQDAQLRGLLAVGMLRRAGTFLQVQKVELDFHAPSGNVLETWRNAVAAGVARASTHLDPEGMNKLPGIRYEQSSYAPRDAVDIIVKLERELIAKLLDVAGESRAAAILRELPL